MEADVAIQSPTEPWGPSLGDASAFPDLHFMRAASSSGSSNVPGNGGVQHGRRGGAGSESRARRPRQHTPATAHSASRPPQIKASRSYDNELETSIVKDSRPVVYRGNPTSKDDLSLKAGENPGRSDLDRADNVANLKTERTKHEESSSARRIPTLSSITTQHHTQGRASHIAVAETRVSRSNVTQGAQSPSPKTKLTLKEKSPGGRRRANNRTRQQRVTEESPSRGIPTPVKSSQQAPTRPKVSQADSVESIPVEIYMKEKKEPALTQGPSPQPPTNLDLSKPKASVILEVKDGPSLVYTPSENMLSDSSMADGSTKYFSSESHRKARQKRSRIPGENEPVSPHQDAHAHGSVSSKPQPVKDVDAPTSLRSPVKPQPMPELVIPPLLRSPVRSQPPGELKLASPTSTATKESGVSFQGSPKEPSPVSIPHDEIVVGPRRPICYDIFLKEDQEQQLLDQSVDKPRPKINKASGSSSLPSPARKKKLKGKGTDTSRDDTSSSSFGKVTVSKSADFADGSRGHKSFDSGDSRRFPVRSPFSMQTPEADTTGFHSQSILMQMKAGVRHDDIVVGPRRNQSISSDTQSPETGAGLDDLVITEQPTSSVLRKDDSKALQSVLSVDSGCEIVPLRETEILDTVVSETQTPTHSKHTADINQSESRVTDTAPSPDTSTQEQSKASSGRWRPKEKQSGVQRVRRGRKGENVSSESGYATDITSRQDISFDPNAYKIESMDSGTWDNSSAYTVKSGSSISYNAAEKLRSKSTSPSAQLHQQHSQLSASTSRGKSQSTNTTPIKRQIQPVKLHALSSIPIPASHEPPTKHQGSRLPVAGGARAGSRSASRDSSASRSNNVPSFSSSISSTRQHARENTFSAAAGALSPQEIASLEAAVANSNKIPTRDKIPRSPPLPRQQLVLRPPSSEETSTSTEQFTKSPDKRHETSAKSKSSDSSEKRGGSSEQSEKDHAVPTSGKSSSAHSTPARKKPPGSLQLKNLSNSQPLLASEDLSTKQTSQNIQKDPSNENESTRVPPEKETVSVESTPKKKSNLKKQKSKADDQSSLGSLPSSEGTCDAPHSEGTTPLKLGSPVKPRLHRSAEQLFKEAKLSIFNSSENIRHMTPIDLAEKQKNAAENSSEKDTPSKHKKSQLPRAVDNITPLRKLSHDFTGRGRGLGFGLPRRGSDRSREILRRGSDRVAVPLGVGVHDPSVDDLKKATSLKELCQSMASLLNIDNERAAEMLTTSLSQRQDLVEGLDADAILDYLTHHGVLDPAILDTGGTTTQRNSALIRHVEEHGQTAVALFINALRQSGQLHLASSLDTEQRIKPVTGEGYFGKRRHKGEVTIRLEVDALKLWAPREPRTDHAINASLLATPSDQAAPPFDLSEEEDVVKPRSCWCFCFPRSRSKSGNHRKSSDRKKNAAKQKYVESSQPGANVDPSGQGPKDTNTKPHRTKSKEKKKKEKETSSKDKKGKKAKGGSETKEDLSAVPDVVFSTRNEQAKITMPSDQNGADTGLTGDAKTPGSTSRRDTEGWDPIIMEYDPQLELVKLRAGQEELASPTRQSGNIGIMCEQWKSSGKFFSQKAVQLCTHIVRQFHDGIVKYFEQDRGTLVLDVLTEGCAVLVVNICMKRSQIEKLQTDIETGALLGKFKELFLSHIDLTVWDIRGVNFRIMLDSQQKEIALSELS